MKPLDWGPYPKNLVVECFNRSAGVSFRIKASTLEEAEEKVKEVLEKQHPSFLRRCHGKYKTKYVKEIT